MVATAPSLPDDIDALKALVSDLRQSLEGKDTEIALLKEQINLLLAKRFGPSSERLSPDQLHLFNEAEAEAAPEPEAPTVHVPAHERKKRGRRPLPEHLPRVDVLHDLPESDKSCPCGCGETLQRIGEVVSEQLDIVPAQIRVLRHIRPKYACPCCQQGVTTAPLPPQPIPKSVASPGLLAHVAVAKYEDALPLYRQEAILQRIGVDLPRATLATWMIQVGQLIQPLINLLREHLLGYDIIQMDETTVQVLKEPDRPPTSKSYLWVQRGGPPDQPVILYTYAPSRSQAVAQGLLTGFAGYLQSDGYEVYAAVARRPEVTLVGCFAHARRKFDEALKAQGSKPQGGKAAVGLATIQRLYRVEREAKDLSPLGRQAYRHTHARPILDELRAWLDRSLPEVPPTSAIGKALGYLANQWDKLVAYLADGRLAIDNNRAENAIRPFVVGRKNWLFSDTVHGAEASANLYSLIQTAKANGHAPYDYLRRVLTELPKAERVEDIERLLPFAVDPDGGAGSPSP